MQRTYRSFLLLGWALSVLACARTQPDVIIVTATFEPSSSLGATTTEIPALVAVAPEIDRPTANPTRQRQFTNTEQYVVQPGDTLSTIAFANGTTTDVLLTVNDLPNPDILSVGQVINLPAAPTDETPAIKLISDSGFIRGESGSQFNVSQFVEQQPGYLKTMSDEVDQSLANGFRQKIRLTGSEVVERVALEFSVDPRLLLALLEYRAGWLTNPSPSENLLLYPMGEVDENRQGLYKQLAWTADRLNRGYYGWKYRDWEIIQFEGGERLFYNSELNAGTVGVQYFLSLNNTFENWSTQVSVGGFELFYRSLFGNPFASETAVPAPFGLIQPDLTLPFAPGETWFYTGGPHGGWGSGSAWSAIDFAPPDERQAGQPACYTSEFPIRSVANGNIVRSEGGAVVLDLDDDFNEATGWTILYLHIAIDGRVTAGTPIQVGDVIGYASCEGGFSTATHMHIGRRYNGEWIPAYCNDCQNESDVPVFAMSGWSVIGFDDQEYQGLIVRGNDRRQAEQGRLNPINRVSW